MGWRTHMGYFHKTMSLDQRFRFSFEGFLDDLEVEGLRFALGDCRRDLTREWELWRTGRTWQPQSGLPTTDPNGWEPSGKIVTRVKPGSGMGPHFYGLAGDVYPEDENGQLMTTKHEAWKATIARFWELAEARGLDALGHREDVPEDEYWSEDPCHFQATGWRSMRPAHAQEV